MATSPTRDASVSVSSRDMATALYRRRGRDESDTGGKLVQAQTLEGLKRGPGEMGLARWYVRLRETDVLKRGLIEGGLNRVVARVRHNRTVLIEGEQVEARRRVVIPRHGERGSRPHQRPVHGVSCKPRRFYRSCDQGAGPEAEAFPLWGPRGIPEANPCGTARGGSRLARAAGSRRRRAGCRRVCARVRRSRVRSRG